MSPSREGTMLELVDALILFDNLMLDHRFQQAIRHHPSEDIRSRLAQLPDVLSEGARITRRAGVKWETIAGDRVDPELAHRAEGLLLNAVLQAAEEQMRLKVFLARGAPTREVRDLLEDAVEKHRVLAQTLRDAMKSLNDSRPEAEVAWSASGPVATENAVGDLRGQVEGEIRRLQREGATPRAVHLSPTAVRHLRDQGLFRNGKSTVEGVSVVVEMAWNLSEYAISTFESVPLEELVTRA